MIYKVHDIFATPVFSSKDFLSEENLKDLFESAKNEEYKKTPSESKISLTNNFLKKFPTIKNDILKVFDDYCLNILKINLEELQFKMGSSWTTLTKPNDTSHQHFHSNYYYSGVIYLSENPSPISFYLGPYIYNFRERFTFNHTHTNKYNTDKVSYYPEKNELIFFPSYVTHQIEKNISDKDRYSLAFNIHPSGVYGQKDSKIHVEVFDDLE
jgi:uncharacterized protein (TIGR02466 family)